MCTFLFLGTVSPSNDLACTDIQIDRDAIIKLHESQNTLVARMKEMQWLPEGMAYTFNVYYI